MSQAQLAPSELRLSVRSVQMSALQLMAEHDLTLSFSDCNQVLEEQRRQAASAWDVVERVCLQEAQRRADNIPVSAPWLAYLTRLPDVAAFGYSAGSIMCQVFGGSRDASEQAGIASALFNVFSSLFDRVCDEEPELLAQLIGLVNPESISACLWDGRPLQPLDSDDGYPPLLEASILSLEAYLVWCRQHLHAASDGSLGDACAANLLTMYDAEVVSNTCVLGPGSDRDQEVDWILFAKSVLPAWQICISAIALTPSPGLDLRRAQEASLWIGRSIWIADDLQDLGTDLEADSWNALWRSLSYDHKVPLFDADGRRIATSTLLSSLVRSGALRHAVGELCRSLERGCAVLATMCDESQVKRLRTALEARIKLWIMS